MSQLPRIQCGWVGQHSTNMEAHPPFPSTRAARFLLRAAAATSHSSTSIVRPSSIAAPHGSHEPLGRNVEGVRNRHAKVSSLFPLIQPLGKTPLARALGASHLAHSHIIRLFLPLPSNPTLNSTPSCTHILNCHHRTSISFAFLSR